VTNQKDTPEGPRFFLLVGPLRTGSSLMARCIDDHEDAICLCESEIQRTLFPDYDLRHHVNRMRSHGFSIDQIIDLLNRRVPRSVNALFAWYSACFRVAEPIYGKRNLRAFGDKSPDFYRIPEIIAAFADRIPLIYTVRDPRSIIRSIWRQDDSTEKQKEGRWSDFVGNIQAWRPHWDRPNLLESRYEDLVRTPQAAMARVYAHIGLSESDRFLQDFPRKHPQRFLWSTNVDLETGTSRAFDPARAEIGNDDISDEQLDRLNADADIAAYRERFGYPA
jgi:hypothetical protein